MITTGNERFQNGAKRYAAYLETFEGRLRSDLAFANLEEFLPRYEPLRVLDIGGGTGATAVRLARMGIHVTLLDTSTEMLGIAKGAAEAAGTRDQIELLHGDITQSSWVSDTSSFDVVLCHNILEYVDDPVSALRVAARAMRDTSTLLSILVRNQAGEVLKAAIQSGNLADAENHLTAEFGRESLYGGEVRLFTAHSLQAMLQAASLTPIALRGVRVLADYLPPNVPRDSEYQQIFELERKLGKRSEFTAVARYLHCFAHPVHAENLK